MLVFNPPYDERLKVERVAALYRRIGDVLKRGWSGYTAWMFTGNLVAAKQIGLRTAARIPLNNGPIECRLLKFPLFAGTGGASPETPRAAELPIGDDVLQSADAAEVPAHESKRPSRPAPAVDQTLAEFRNRLKRMGKHWSRWARRQGIECYRVYDRDIPDVPLVIDRYGRWLHVVEHARPHGRTPIEQRQFFERLVAAAGEELGVPAEDIFAHPREPAERPDRARGRQIVSEAGRPVQINLANRGETGLPLAERELQRWIAAEAAGKLFWNVFGRGGAATVFAAAAGAAASLTIEGMPGLADWSRENLTLAGCDPAQHVVVAGDVVELAAQFVTAGAPPFDLVLAAPPAGYHRRSEHAGWDPKPELLTLLRAILPLVVSGGKIYFVTPARRFKLEAGDLPGTTIRDLTRRSVPPDFQARPPHRCWSIVRE